VAKEYINRQIISETQEFNILPNIYITYPLSSPPATLLSTKDRCAVSGTYNTPKMIEANAVPPNMNPILPFRFAESGLISDGIIILINIPNIFCTATLRPTVRLRSSRGRDLSK
jgi:hypothetical protein